MTSVQPDDLLEQLREDECAELLQHARALDISSDVADPADH